MLTSQASLKHSNPKCHLPPSVRGYLPLLQSRLHVPDMSLLLLPFHPMDMKYDWRFMNPNTQAQVIHLENWKQGNRVFDATLTL